MKKRTWTSAILVALALGLGACSDDSPEADAVPTGDEAEVLADLGLEGLTPKEVVEELDRVPLAERNTALYASVRPDELHVEYGDEEFALDLEDAGFYLSFAPYVNTTHDCYFHSLTTCVGELGGEEIDVTITSADGEELVNETVTTFDNGFYGLWLEHDIEGTLEVTYGDYSGSVDIATGPEDATCISTLQLT